MVQVKFIQTDGQMRVVEGAPGDTILRIALENGIPMEHACGGNGFCTTCSCDIENGTRMIEEGAVSAVNDREENMGVEGPDRRLGCQTKVNNDITVRIVEV